VLRAIQRRGGDLFTAVAVNYVVAAALSAALLVARGGTGDGGSVAVLAFGTANGILYFLHLVLIQASYRIAGVGITTALIGAGAVIPVITSWAVWGEPMTPLRWGAALLLIPAMWLLRPRSNGTRRLTAKADTILALVCAVAGTVGVLHKAAAMRAPVQRDPTYQLALFVAAAVCSGAYALARRRPWSARAALSGSALGLTNFFATVCLLGALAALPATVVFPITSPSSIAANTILARFLWHERLTPRQFVGMVLAIAVVVLASV